MDCSAHHELPPGGAECFKDSCRKAEKKLSFGLKSLHPTGHGGRVCMLCQNSQNYRGLLSYGSLKCVWTMGCSFDQPVHPLVICPQRLVQRAKSASPLQRSITLVLEVPFRRGRRFELIHRVVRTKKNTTSDRRAWSKVCAIELVGPSLHKVDFCRCRYARYCIRRPHARYEHEQEITSF